MQLKKLIRQISICVSLVILVVLAFASKGGGGDKKNNIKNDFTPIRTTNGFTLKTGPSYNGSHIFSQEKANDILSFNTVVTYQKGNTIYILPYKYKVNISSLSNSSKSNLQFLGIKIKMPK